MIKNGRGKSLIDSSAVLPPALARWGRSPVAYLGFKDNLRRFGSDQDGYISYRDFSGASFALGDPIAPEESWAALIERFITTHDRPVFVQTSKRTASFLKNCGLHVSPFGVETELVYPLNLGGKQFREVRNLYNRGQRNGIVVREIHNGELHEVLPARSDRISGSRFKQGLSFLAQSDYDIYDTRLRWMAGYADRELVGVSLFYPMFLNNEVVGYAEILPYRAAEAPKGTRVTILLKALEILATEGSYLVNLGLSPFRIRDKALYSGSWLSRLFRQVYRRGNLFFNFSGLGFHKARYGGLERDVYFASPKKLPILELMKLYRMASGAWLPPLRRRK